MSENNGINLREKSNNGLFFTDGRRRNDFILVYQKINDNKRKRKIRLKFLKFLITEGLEIEIQDENGNIFSLENIDFTDNSGNIVFIKLFAKWETLCRYAELLKIRKPILHFVSNYQYKQISSFRKYFRKFNIFNVFNVDELQSMSSAFTMPFSLSKELLFKIPENKQNFFIPSERSLIVNYILRRISFQCSRNECGISAEITHTRCILSRPRDIEMYTISGVNSVNSEIEFSNCYSKNYERDETQIKKLLSTQKNHKLINMSLHNLMSEQVFENAYCLHENLIEENSNFINERILLYQNWASLRNIFRPQPLDSIRSYFGEKIAFYFSWLGYYTYWLLFPSLLGILVTIYNVLQASRDSILKDIKEGINITMCPLLCNSRECKFWKLSDVYYKFFIIRILDNKTMILMAFAMSVWASLFLEMWKRKQYQLAFHWNVHDLQNQHEPPRPEFLISIETNQSNEQNETFVPFWRRKIPVLFFTYSTVLFSIILALAFLVGIILYEIVIYSLLMIHPNPMVSQFSNIIISVSGSMISLIVILTLTMFYAKMAHWLTDLENYKTQSEYDNSVTMKLYLLEFVNNYSYLFYFGFILPFIQPLPGFRSGSYLKPFGCPTGGCLFGLAVQLSFIMIGRQLISQLTEYSLPRFCSSIKKCQLRQSMKAAKCQNKNLLVVEPELIRCSTDFMLADLESQPVFYEYLEMLIQFGFITMFIPAFPLAPLLALINNYFEIRSDALKFITAYKRPVAQRVKDIGTWINILSVVAEISVKSNAILIAFTTFFIERIVYILKYSPTGDLEGFVVWTLSYLKSSEFKSSTNETFCRYMDFRHPPWDIKSGPLSLTPVYWEILAAKVIFIYLFENLVYLIMKIISAAIPNVSEKVSKKISKEVTITRNLILKCVPN